MRARGPVHYSSLEWEIWGEASPDTPRKVVFSGAGWHIIEEGGREGGLEAIIV